MREYLNIYIADDHQIVIDGLMLLLKNEEGISIIGYSNNGQKAFEDILSLKPDIALLDLRMPDKEGMEVIRSLAGKSKTKCIILSMHSDKRYINDAANYGAYGYLLKNTNKNELIKTIRKVASGEKCFPTIDIVKDKAKLFLTPRELDIFKLILREFTSQQIADKFSLSHFTVSTHRKNILKKTGMKNIAGLLKFAMDHNINIDE